MKKRKFVIIDGHALIHRAYHALPPLTTKQGEVVNAVYGFSVILLNVIKELKPECIAVAMDLPDKTFRHEEYEQYKANRVAAPDDLIQQFDIVREVIEAFDIPIYEKPGFEADDIIGSVAKKLTKDNETSTYIVTGDLDELQLVDKNTLVYTMKRGFTDTVIYDEKMVHERYGLTPEEFVHFKALKGDASDNIPGVAGIGEKTASDLIQTYASLDNLYKNLDKLKPSVAKKLEDSKEIAYLSLKLSRIVTDIPINVDFKKCATHDFDRNKVFELFRRLEFKSLLSKLPGQPDQSGLFDEEAPKTKSQEHFCKENYHTIDDEKDLSALAKRLEKAKVIAVDTETDSIDEMSANLVGISICFEECDAYYIPVRHKKGKQLPFDIIKKYLSHIFSGKIPKVGHNIKFDYVILRNAGFKLSPISFDTMVAAYLLNPNARAQRLDELAFSELGIEMSKIDSLIGKGKDQLTFDQVDIDKATLYAAEDADMSLRLYHHLSKEMEEGGFIELMDKIEAPLVPVLAEMEMNGVKLDTRILARLSEKFANRIKELEKEIYKYADGEFNIASPAQLQKVLFEKLNLQEKIEKNGLKKLPSGGYSTGAEELEKLREIHPIINLISEYRELTKLKNTYVDTLPKSINKKTGRVHTSFNQTIAATGRLSSTNPNLQNIPIRSEVGQDIRKAFIADNGYSIISADYSQIELRVIAHIADDVMMKKAFVSGQDIHTSTAMKVYNVSEKEVTPEMRRNAKVVNFGIVYGVSPHGLARQSNLNYEEAKDFIDKYFEIHPGIKEYMKQVVIDTREAGFAETIFGRRRYLPELNSANHIIRNAAERMALNMPIQGTAADLIKLAMIEIHRELPKVSPKSKMLLQVHDELVFEVPDMEVAKVTPFIKEKMENVVKLDVPVIVEIGVGKNWGEAK
ncbi:MAG: DNA polymerase I [Patescibacteria group bacterium]